MAWRKLSSRQQEAFDFVESFIFSYGYPPSGEEVAEGLGITSGPARRLLYKLNAKGFIQMSCGDPRSIVITHGREGSKARA